jgi:FkbM family methyltransferase
VPVSLRHRLRPLVRRGQWLIDCARGRDLWFSRDVRLPTEVHGTAYGAWAILRDQLSANSRVISAGVGEDVSFDLALIEKYGCTIHALDPTPKSIQWVRENIRDPRFVLHACALSASDEPLRLFLPTKDIYVSASCRAGRHTSNEYVDVPAVTLPAFLDQLGFDEVDVLKMDIEGAEYGVIEHGLRSGAFDRVRQLLIEFHHYHPVFGIGATRRAVRALRDAGWRIAWVSPSHHELLFVPMQVVRQSSEGFSLSRASTSFGGDGMNASHAS